MLVAISAAVGSAQTGDQVHHHAKAPAEQAGPASLKGLRIPDVLLRNQDGKTVRFPDLVKDKVVAINTIFTTCTTICPLMGVTFARVQKDERIRSRLGTDLALISISVDPIVDTPQRLKNWSGKLGAQPGWTLLTSLPGEKSVVDGLLKALNVFTPDKENHSPVVLIGSEAAGEWTRTNGLASPKALVKAIRAVTDSDAPAEAAIR